MARALLSRFERGIAVSRPAAEHAARAWGRPLTVVANGVPTATFRPPERSGNDASPNGNLRLLFVGNWRDRRKGLLHLLEAYDLLRADGVSASLDIVGEGRPDVRERPGVVFRGRVASETELAEHYRRCDVFVAPSTGQESFGIVLLEAMASARPIVCSDIPGYRHVVDPDGSRLVPPGNARERARALSNLARQPELRRRMGASNCARAPRPTTGAPSPAGCATSTWRPLPSATARLGRKSTPFRPASDGGERLCDGAGRGAGGRVRAR